jgi:hypothetical protein
MAFLAPQEEEQDKQQGQQDPEQQGQATAGKILSGPSQAPIQGGGQQASATTAGKPTSSGQFTNLRKYIDANQGNDANMGTQVRGQVDTGANAAKGIGEQFEKEVKTDVVNNTVTDTSGTTAAIAALGGLSAPAAPAPATASGAQAARPAATPGPAPKQEAPKPLDPNEFAKLYNAQYGGKQSVQDFGNFGTTKNAFGLVEQRGKMAGSGDFGDRSALLKDTFQQGGKQYTRGENTLDSFILGGGEGGAQALEGIAKDYGTFGENFTNLSNVLGGEITKGKTATDTTRETLRKTVTDATGALDTRFREAAKKAVKQNELDAGAETALKAGDVAALKKAGLSDDAITLLRNAHKGDLSAFVDAGADFGAGDFADQKDVANYQQLAALLGGANATFGGEFANEKFAKTGKAGGISSDVVNAANTFTTLDAATNKRMAEENKKRTKQLEDLRMGVRFNDQFMRDDFLKKSGLSAEDYDYARQNSIDLSQFISGGRNVTRGDLLSTKEREQFDELARLLNLSAPDITSKGVDDYYSVDSSSAFQAIQNHKAQKAAEAAAKAAAEQTAADAAAQQDQQKTNDAIFRYRFS